MESFAAALKRYIAAGYKAPDAMRAVWHDVRIGRVERPRRPGRRYRHAVAGIPGRPLYNRRRRGGNPVTEVFDLGSRREWEQAIRDVGGLKVAKQDRPDYVDVPGYLQGYKRGMAPDELVQQVSDATGVPPRDVERAMFRAFKGRRRGAPREEDFDVEAWKAAGPTRRAVRGGESRPRVMVMRDTFGLRPRSPFKGAVHYVTNPGRRGMRRKYVAGGDIFRSTISAREAGRLVRASGARRLPRIGWCTRLSDGREVCHDVSGYYLVGTARNPLTRGETGKVLAAARHTAKLSRRYAPPSMTAPASQDPRARAAHRGWWLGQSEAYRSVARSYGTKRRGGRARFARSYTTPGQVSLSNPARRGRIDTEAARELRLYIDNDSRLYHSMTVPIMRNLCGKIRRGQYQRGLAIKGWGHLVLRGAQQYAREFDHPSRWHTIFPPVVRHRVARELALYFERELRLGAIRCEDLTKRGRNPGARSPIYTRHQRWPKYTSQVSPLSADFRTAGRMLRQRWPADKAGYLREGDAHAANVDKLDTRYQRMLGAALDNLRHRGIEPGPLISGIVSGRFPERTKTMLRSLAHTATAEGDAAMAAYAAAGLRIDTARTRYRGHLYSSTIGRPTAEGGPFVRNPHKLGRLERRRMAHHETPPYGEHTGIKHAMMLEPYWQAMQRADYYRWSASRGFVGRDPLTGREERTPAHRAAATACDKAQARVWLDQAAKLRGSMRQVLPRNPLERKSAAAFLRGLPRGTRLTKLNPRTARFCPETIAPKGRFDPRSFRTVVARGHRVTVACPRGTYAAHGGGRCRHALEAQRILHPAGEGRCPYGGPQRRARRNPPGRRATLTTFYDRIDEVRGRRLTRTSRPGPYKHRFTSGPRARGVDRGGWHRLRRGQVVLGGRRPIYAQLPGGR